jgi:drug/metabolite transporter (DMT)-like permease
MAALGEISALATAALWSGSSLAFASASRRLGPMLVNTSRLLLATGMLWIVVIFTGVETHLSSRQTLNLAISGVVGLSLGDSFLFKAYQFIGARLTMVVMAIAPAIAAFLAFIILGEVVTATTFVGIFVTLAGIAVVIAEQRDPAAFKFTRVGVFYAFLGAVGQGSGLVFAKMAFMEGDIDGFFAAFVRLLSSLIVLLPILFLARRLENPFTIAQKDRKGAGMVVIGSVLGPFLGITCSLLAVKHTEVGIAATLMSTVPILMLPLVRVVYHERLSWRAIVGAVIAVGGVALLFLR